MGHLFYFFGLIVVLLNIFIISRFKRIFELKEWMVKFKNVTGRNPVATDYRKNDDKDILTTWSVSVITTSLWIFFGLLTKSWYVYLAILIFSTLLNVVGKSLGEFSKITFLIFLIKSLLTLFIIGFLTINHFHLHWDIWNMFTQCLHQ
jgi:hypothetical protein